MIDRTKPYFERKERLSRGAIYIGSFQQHYHDGARTQNDVYVVMLYRRPMCLEVVTNNVGINAFGFNDPSATDGYREDFKIRIARIMNFVRKTWDLGITTPLRQVCNARDLASRSSLAKQTEIYADESSAV